MRGLRLDRPAAREDADPDEVRRLRKDLKLFLDKYVVPHVQELTPGFQQVRVVKVLPYVPPEDDAAAAKKKFNKPVEEDEDEDEPETIRVQFLWKSEANVDYFCGGAWGWGWAWRPSCRSSPARCGAPRPSRTCWRTRASWSARRTSRCDWRCTPSTRGPCSTASGRRSCTRATRTPP